MPAIEIDESTEIKEKPKTEDKAGMKTSEFWVVAGVLFFILLAATILVWFGKITNAQWVTVCTAVPGVLVSFYTTARTWLKGKAIK